MLSDKETKQLHAKQEQRVNDILKIISEIGQQLFEINQCTMLPIELCTNAKTVLQCIRNTESRLLELQIELRVKLKEYTKPYGIKL